jgi:hypothetical protein
MADILANQPPPTLRLVCKDGQTVDAHDQLLALASRYLSDLINVKRAEAADKAKTSAGSNATARTADAASQSDQRIATPDDVIELCFPDDRAGDWQLVLEMLHPVTRAGLPTSNWVRLSGARQASLRLAAAKRHLFCVLDSLSSTYLARSGAGAFTA